LITKTQDNADAKAMIKKDVGADLEDKRDGFNTEVEKQFGISDAVPTGGMSAYEVTAGKLARNTLSICNTEQLGQQNSYVYCAIQMHLGRLKQASGASSQASQARTSKLLKALSCRFLL
jgi:hypothetical protein